MGRSAWLTLAAAGLSTTMLVLTFPGCGFEDETVSTGKCEDDGNPCTNDECPSGATVHKAVPTEEKRPCTRGINAGLCVQEADGAAVCALDCVTNGTPCNCTNDDECQTSTDCSKWSCTAGKCENKLVEDDTVVGMDTAEDCLHSVCRAGIVKLEPDDDPPADSPGDCLATVCVDGKPMEMAADDPPPTVAGDCTKFVCINGMKQDMADNDPPPATDCITYSCANKMIVMSNDPPGTLCMNNTRACNSIGQCADCLSAGEYSACTNLNNNCPVKQCTGQVCGTDATICQSGFCSDTVCCDEACTGECRSCKLAAPGQCGNIGFYDEDSKFTDPTTMNPDRTCKKTDLHACNGVGKCLTLVKQPCSANGDCISGQCFDIMMGTDYCLGAAGEPCMGDATICISKTCEAGLCK